MCVTVKSQIQYAAETIKHFKILIMHFSVMVTLGTGAQTKLVTFQVY